MKVICALWTSVGLIGASGKGQELNGVQQRSLWLSGTLWE